MVKLTFLVWLWEVQAPYTPQQSTTKISLNKAYQRFEGCVTEILRKGLQLLAH